MWENESPLYKCPQYAVEAPTVRMASFMATKALESFDVEMSMRRDVYDNVVAFKRNVGVDELSPEMRRFVDRIITEGKRNGRDLTHL